MSHTQQLYINAACRIGNNQAWKDGQLFFEQAGVPGDEFMVGLYRKLNLQYPKWYKMDRLSKLGVLAAEIVLGMGYEVSCQAGERAIVLANSHSSLDTDARFVSQMRDIPSPAVFVYTLPNIVSGEISIRHCFKGEQAFFVSAQPDMEFLYSYVRAIFADGRTRVCLMGWADIFGEQFNATMYRVSADRDDSVHSMEFNTQNLYQYFYHEQGAVS